METLKLLRDYFPSAVAVGTANFIEPGCAVKIIEGIKKYCARKKISNIKNLVGSLEG